MLTFRCLTLVSQVRAGQRTTKQTTVISHSPRKELISSRNRCLSQEILYNEDVFTIFIGDPDAMSVANLTRFLELSVYFSVNAQLIYFQNFCKGNLR